MTSDHPIETPISSSKAFESALAAIVESAVAEGVDVRGAWEFETRGSLLEWEVNVSELDRDDAADATED
jgi:hypothetical protein